jgi:alpha-L-fucosidase 2
VRCVKAAHFLACTDRTQGFAASGDDDLSFLQEVRAKRAAMDKGIRVGSCGQLQEWKIDIDSQTDTHRHLSHLVGMYPGHALSQFTPAVQNPALVNGTRVNYTVDDVHAAVKVSLVHRGNGTGPDADSG